MRIVAGPFADFVGAIDSLDLNHDKVVVLVDIFGRETSTSISIAEVIPA